MRVLIVDDHAVVRQGLRAILAEEFCDADFGEAQDAPGALQQIRSEQWDVIVLDITMPGRGGLDVLKDAKRLRPDVPVVVLSMHPEDQYAVRVLKAGASAYLTKETASEKLVQAIRKALTGGTYVSASLAESLAPRLATVRDGLPHENLSDREFQVLCLIASGKTVTEIAEGLSLSVKTVSTYRTRIQEKTGMRTNAELTRYAFEHDLVR